MSVDIVRWGQRRERRERNVEAGGVYGRSPAMDVLGASRSMGNSNMVVVGSIF